MRTNYAAVAVCAVVYWLLGALWYHVFFPKQWMAFESSAGARMTSFPSVWSHVITFALSLLLAFALAQICLWRNANTAARGAAIGVLLWLGIIGPITFTTYVFEMRPIGLFAINEFYPLAGLCIMGAILGAWKKTAS